MIRDTVEITACIAQDERNGVPIRFYELDGTDRQLNSCYGDLLTILNVMADYADLLDDYRATYPERLDDYQTACYGYQAEKCRRIQKSFEDQIGYDRAAAIEKCRKRREKKDSEDDVGEEALVLMARRARNEARKKKEEQEKKETPVAEVKKKHDDLDGQMNLFG